MLDESLPKVSIRPSPAEDFVHAALQYHQRRQLPQAEALYRECLSVDADHFDSLYLLGTLLFETRRFQEGIELLQRAVAMNANSATAPNNLGIALKAADRLEEALRNLDKAIELKPNLAKTHYNRGNTLMELKRFDEALISFDNAISLSPDYGEAYCNRGSALRELKQFDAALASYSAAIALMPDYADAYNNRGAVLAEQGRLEEALADSNKAIALQPDVAGAYYTKGSTLRDLKQLDEALENFDKAIALKPDWDDAYFAKSAAMLMLGRFSEGWKLYERRPKSPLAKKLLLTQPFWDGRADLRGKRILIHCEQGFGDTFQFIRYVRCVQNLGAAVTLCATDLLVRFLKQLEPEIRILGSEADPGEFGFDFHCSLLSLPMAMESTLASIPSIVPYLSAESERILRWRKRLGEQGFKIGICWDGRSDKDRSFPVSMFSSISQIPQVRLISLQKGEAAGQLLALTDDLKVEVLGDDFDVPGESFLDTAAVMKSCDLVIACDTSIAHLAGALGIPVWVALKWNAEWRWMLDRDDSPWYPTMRLFRQKSRGDWDAPFCGIESELRKIVG